MGRRTLSGRRGLSGHRFNGKGGSGILSGGGEGTVGVSLWFYPRHRFEQAIGEPPVRGADGLATKEGAGHRHFREASARGGPNHPLTNVFSTFPTSHTDPWGEPWRGGKVKIYNK